MVGQFYPRLLVEIIYHRYDILWTHLANFVCSVSGGTSSKHTEICQHINVTSLLLTRDTNQNRCDQMKEVSLTKRQHLNNFVQHIIEFISKILMIIRSIHVRGKKRKENHGSCIYISCCPYSSKQSWISI